MAGFGIKREVLKEQLQTFTVNVQSFLNDPVTYLGRRKLIAEGGVETDLSAYNGDFGSCAGVPVFNHVAKVSLAKFYLVLTSEGFKFARANSGSGAELQGYYLPWNKDRAYLLQLGGDANFFLTAQLNGCCFMVSGDRASPKVLHANCNGQVNQHDAKDDRLAKYKRGYLNLATALFKKGTFKDADDTTIFDPEMYHGASRCVIFGIRKSSQWTFYYTLSGEAGGITGRLWPDGPKDIPQQPT